MSKRRIVLFLFFGERRTCWLLLRFLKMTSTTTSPTSPTPPTSPAPVTPMWRTNNATPGAPFRQYHDGVLRDTGATNLMRAFNQAGGLETQTPVGGRSRPRDAGSTPTNNVQCELFPKRRKF